MECFPFSIPPNVDVYVVLTGLKAANPCKQGGLKPCGSRAYAHLCELLFGGLIVVHRGFSVFGPLPIGIQPRWGSSREGLSNAESRRRRCQERRGAILAEVPNLRSGVSGVPATDKALGRASPSCVARSQNRAGGRRLSSEGDYV